MTETKGNNQDNSFRYDFKVMLVIYFLAYSSYSARGRTRGICIHFIAFKINNTQISGVSYFTVLYEMPDKGIYGLYWQNDWANLFRYDHT